MAQPSAEQDMSPVETFCAQTIAAKSQVVELLEQPEIRTIFVISDQLYPLMVLSTQLEHLPTDCSKWFSLNLVWLYSKMKLVDLGPSPVAEIFPNFYGDMFLQSLGHLEKSALQCIVRVFSQERDILGADDRQRDGNLPFLCTIVASHLYFEESDVASSMQIIQQVFNIFQPRHNLNLDFILNNMSEKEFFEEARLNLLRLMDKEENGHCKTVSNSVNAEGEVRGAQPIESVLQYTAQTATLLATMEPLSIVPVCHYKMANNAPVEPAAVVAGDQEMVPEPLVAIAPGPLLSKEPQILPAVPTSEPLRRSIRIQKRKIQMESTPKEATSIPHSPPKTTRTSSGPPRKSAAPKRRKPLPRHEKFVAAVHGSAASHLRDEKGAIGQTLVASAANVQEDTCDVETSAGVPRRPLHRQSQQARATRESAPSPAKGRRSRPAEVRATVPALASNLPASQQPFGHSYLPLPLSNVLPANPAEFTPAKVTKRVTAARRTQRQQQGVPYDKRRRVPKKLTVAFDCAQLCSSRQVDSQPKVPPPTVQPMESEVSQRGRPSRSMTRREPRSRDRRSAGTQTQSSQRKRKASSGRRNGPSPRAEQTQQCSKRPKLARKPKKEKLVPKVIDPCQLRLLAQQFAVQPNHTGLRRSKRQTAVFATEFIRHCVTKPSGTWQDWATWEDFKIKDLYTPPVLRKLKANDQTTVTPRRTVRASRARIR